MRTVWLFLALSLSLAGCRDPDGDISPTGDRAVFTNSDGLFMTDSSGKKQTLVDHDCTDPVWSPSGDYVLYRDAVERQAKLYDLNRSRIIGLDSRLSPPWCWNGDSTEISGCDAKDGQRILTLHLPSRQVVRTYLSPEGIVSIVRDPTGRRLAVRGEAGGHYLLDKGTFAQLDTGETDYLPWFGSQGNLYGIFVNEDLLLEDWAKVVRFQDLHPKRLIEDSALEADAMREGRITFILGAKPIAEGRMVLFGAEDASPPGVAARCKELLKAEQESSDGTLGPLVESLRSRRLFLTYDEDGRLLDRAVGPVTKFLSDWDNKVVCSLNGRKAALIGWDQVRFIDINSSSADGRNRLSKVIAWSSADRAAAPRAALRGAPPSASRALR